MHSKKALIKLVKEGIVHPEDLAESLGGKQNGEALNSTQLVSKAIYDHTLQHQSTCQAGKTPQSLAFLARIILRKHLLNTRKGALDLRSHSVVKSLPLPITAFLVYFCDVDETKVN